MLMSFLGVLNIPGSETVTRKILTIADECNMRSLVAIPAPLLFSALGKKKSIRQRYSGFGFWGQVFCPSNFGDNMPKLNPKVDQASSVRLLLMGLTGLV